MPTHTQSNARLSVDKRKRPVVHILRFDDVTNSLRAMVAAIPETSTKDTDASDKLYCLLVNGNGEVVIDSVDGNAVLLECPPVVLAFTGDDRIMSRKEAALTAGVSIPTLKRADAAGELRKTTISSKRVGYTVAEFEKWLAKRNPD